MTFTLGKFRFDKPTVISIVVVIALLGIGYGVGHLAGEKNVQNDLIERGATQQSLAGTVQSTNKEGFTLKIEPVSGASGASGAIGSVGTAGGQEAPKGTWVVKYGKGGGAISGGVNATGSSNQELKKGDKVQVSGLQVGKNTVIAQSVTKVLPPTPSPTPSASPR